MSKSNENNKGFIQQINSRIKKIKTHWFYKSILCPSWKYILRPIATILLLTIIFTLIAMEITIVIGLLLVMAKSALDYAKFIPAGDLTYTTTDVINLISVTATLATALTGILAFIWKKDKKEKNSNKNNL